MANKVMTNIEFDQHLMEFAGKTKYAMGCFGQVLTKALLDEKRSQYKKNGWYERTSAVDKTKTNYEYLLQFTQGEHKGKWFAGDCVCIQKGILWGYRATPYPGGTPGKYGSNGVKDATDADWYSSLCTDKKTLNNPKNLADYDYPVGSILHMSGHIGEVHNNDANTIFECTPSLDGLKEAKFTYQTSGGKCKWDGIGKSVYLDYVDKKKTDGTISVGDKVTINSGAVYGGLSSTRGTKVPSGLCGKIMTVKKVEPHYNEDEALLEEITSWVAFKYLTKVSTSSSSSSNEKPKNDNVEDTKIVQNDIIKISKGAVFGGSEWGKNVAVPSKYIGVALTVKKVQQNNNQMEALVKELNSWVPTKYIKKASVSGTKAKVNVGVLNIRKGAGVLYGTVGQLKFGDAITVYETKSGWSRIGVDRWVYSNYIVNV